MTENKSGEAKNVVGAFTVFLGVQEAEDLVK